MAGFINAFKRLGQYASSPGTGPMLRRTRSFFPSGDLDHRQYSLCLPKFISWVGLGGFGQIPTRYTRERSPIPVLTGPGVEQLRCTLIKTKALPLSQAAIRQQKYLDLTENSIDNQRGKAKKQELTRLIVREQDIKSQRKLDESEANVKELRGQKPPPTSSSM